MTKTSGLGRFGRALGRSALRTWGRLDLAPGYLCQVVDLWGPSLAEGEPIIGSLPNGCRLDCDLRDFVQRWIWFHGTYEPIEAYLFTLLLRPGMTVIDAGANAGQYSLLAATSVGPTGSVHSFEPVPETFTRLQRAVTDNQLTNVHVNRAALWHEETTLSLAVPAGFSSANHTGAYSVVRKRDDSSVKVEAPALRLDTYVATQGLSRVDVIKMDIEGGEPAALAGARSTLERFQPLLLMEINAEVLEESGSSVAALWDEITRLNYRVWRVGASPEASGHVSHPSEIETCCNAVLHHAELPANVTAGWKTKTALRWARSGW
jgi:FkbM family methyltransferase